jgi:hypothetical protein
LEAAGNFAEPSRGGTKGVIVVQALVSTPPMAMESVKHGWPSWEDYSFNRE